ncbi:MAG: GPW/gp25 family protein [Prolixibacteraceae bacterium]|nr:GPW/gp25 family protein [Prolixibacteraceae bacterium]
MEEYLDIPLQLKEIKDQKDARRIDMKKSIHNIIHLVTVTAYNEVRHAPDFGTEIWKYDFENIYNTHLLKDELKKSIHKSIRNNEKRLSNISINLQIEQVELSKIVKNRRVKTQINMIINGTINKTNEPFEHHETFFIGPLSY